MILNRCGYILLLGLCDGDAGLALEVRAALAKDKTMREAARNAGMAETTFRQLVERVRAGLARVLSAGVGAGELAGDGDQRDSETGGQ